MSKIYDLVIIGAGPGGCMAALGALKENPSANVVIIEKNEVAEHRIGEALLTGTIMSFAEAGIHKEIAAMGYHRKIGATYIWGETREPWYVDYPGQVDGYPEEFMHEGKRVAIHVPRQIFDEQMKDICKKKGVQFIYGEARDVISTEKKVIKGIELANGEKVLGMYFLDCSGQAAFLGRRLSERKPLWTPRVAKYAYFDNLNWDMAKENGFDIHRTNIVSDTHGWTWIIDLGEKGDRLTSVGMVTTPDVAKKLTFENCLDYFPELKKFGVVKGLSGAKDPYGKPLPVDKFVSHPDYTYKTTDLEGPNWAISGDSAVFLDPILSQGVTLTAHYGFMRGRAAVHYLNGDNGEFQRNVTKNYMNEAEILKIVIGEWYQNNRAVDNWRWKAQEISKHLEAFEQRDPVEAFRFITNLENLRDEYDPYPKEVRSHIFTHLMGDRVK